jgi:hypothetical protein
MKQLMQAPRGAASRTLQTGEHAEGALRKKRLMRRIRWIEKQ